MNQRDHDEHDHDHEHGHEQVTIHLKHDIYLHGRVELHVHHHGEGVRTDQIIAAILKLGADMSRELDALKAAVQRNSDAEDSAIALLKGLATQIAALKDDPAKLQALADEVTAKAEALASAVVENTPAQT